MTTRVFNFSAGPATLPEPVLAEAQRDLLALPGLGRSVMELSHRSREFKEILEGLDEDLRRLLNIPAHYKILYLQGGSRLQFSMVPINLMGSDSKSADYILTGSWGEHASAEARKEGTVRLAFSSKATHYDRLPAQEEMDLDPAAAYVHFTSNETIQGVQFDHEPQVGDVPLVCDASSDFLSRPIPVERYGLIYACAQKNTGPAGLTIVIVREDLLERSADSLAGMLNYRNHAQANSLYNTPATFSIYVSRLVARWLDQEVGGLEKMAQRNREKANILYQIIDESEGFYTGHSQPDCRSMMNVTFRLPNDKLQGQFIDDAEKQSLVALKGHRSVGGIRASIYNAMPLAGVQALGRFMKEFRQKYF